MQNQKIRFAVICLIINDGQILIGEKRSDSSKKLAGQWHIPGGSMILKDLKSCSAINDLLSHVVEREMAEETGLDIVFQRQITSIGTLKVEIDEFVNCFWVLCELSKISSRNIQAGGDLQAAKWVKIKYVFDCLSYEAIARMPNSVKLYLQQLGEQKL